MSNDEYRTPTWLFDVLDNRHGFTLDVAATKENRLCDSYITKEQDALSMDWKTDGAVWCNPPYSTGMVESFIEKALVEISLGHCREVVFLIRADTSTSYWQQAELRASEVLFLEKRLHFLAPGGEEFGPYNFPSAVLVFRTTSMLIDVFPGYGRIYSPRE